MKYSATWNGNGNDCTLTITYPDGHHEHVWCEQGTSELLTYVQDNNIPLRLSDCHVFN